MRIYIDADPETLGELLRDAAMRSQVLRGEPAPVKAPGADDPAMNSVRDAVEGMWREAAARVEAELAARGMRSRSIDRHLAVHLDRHGWVTLVADSPLATRRPTWMGLPPDDWDRIVAAVEEMRREAVAQALPPDRGPVAAVEVCGSDEAVRAWRGEREDER